MKKVLYLVCTALMLAVAPSAKAQFVVTDPANLASGFSTLRTKSYRLLRP
jgi:hypothetical protein